MSHGYSGLTVGPARGGVRRTLGSTTSYAVVKNTLTKIAAKDTSIEGVESLLSGPSAITFIKGDPVEAAKGAASFRQGEPAVS